MNLLDPKSVEVGDLLDLIRRIDDRLDNVEDGLGEIDEAVTDVATELKNGRKRKGKGKGKGHHHGHDHDAYADGIAHAVGAVIADLDARHSLIPVDDGDQADDAYDSQCPGCLLRKNGYPRLAQLFADAGPGESDGAH